MFFNNKLIEQYEARIEDLKRQIEDLRALSLPHLSAQKLDKNVLEADAILSGKEEVFEPSDITPEELEAMRLEQSERDRILSGTYIDGME